MVTSPVLYRHRSLISLTNAVFVGHAAIILCTLSLCYRRQSSTDRRWNDIKIHHVWQWGIIQFHRYKLVFAERYFLNGYLALLRYPQQHIALTSSQESTSILIRIFLGDGIEFSIVVQLKLHQSIRHSIALAVNHLNL